MSAIYHRRARGGRGGDGTAGFYDTNDTRLRRYAALPFSPAFFPLIILLFYGFGIHVLCFVLAERIVVISLGFISLHASLCYALRFMFLLSGWAGGDLSLHKGLDREHIVCSLVRGRVEAGVGAQNIRGPGAGWCVIADSEYVYEGAHAGDGAGLAQSFFSSCFVFPLRLPVFEVGLTT